MEKMTKKMMELWKDEEGATMVEYGLMVALVAVVAIVGVSLLGNNLLSRFNEVAAEVGPGAPGTP